VLSIWASSLFLKSWDKSVSIVTRLWTGWAGFNSWQGQSHDLFLHHHIQTGCCPLGLLSNGYWGWNRHWSWPLASI